MSDSREVPAVRVDLSGVRRRLDGAQGRTYWKSLEELAQTPEFLEFLHREFPEQASELTDPRGRREFLTVMGASLALAGLVGCTKQPEEKIVPYVQPPEQVIPGKPLFYATAMLDGGYAKGILVESHLGRPTKIEGNPDHPASLGATDAFGQAWVLGLYDPDRSQTLAYRGEIRAWTDFMSAMRTAMAVQKPRGGVGLRILTETVTSPTFAAQMQEVLGEFPAAKWHLWEPAGGAAAAMAQAVGRPTSVQYRFDRADVIVSLDADFVMDGPASLRYAREYTARRKRPVEQPMNRLYVVESSPSPTGGIADHRLALRAGEIEGFARALAASVGGGGAGASGAAGASAAAAAWVAAVAKDLQAHTGRSLVLAGDFQPPAVHALAHEINQRLGNVGQTVLYGPAVEARPVDTMASLAELAADMKGGKVEVLLVLGSNPVYTAPADLDFAAAMDKVKLRVHLGLYEDETAVRCHWHVPQAHPLEAWSDARAFDGTATIMQPLIAPLYESARSPHEVLAALTNRPDRKGHEIVKDFWRTQLAADFDRAWARALHDGVVAGWTGTAVTANPAVATSAPPPPTAPPAPPARPAGAGGLDIVFRPDPTIQDGRYANLGWLQEVPKPITKLTWDNAALISPVTAERLGLHNNDVVELRYRGRVVEAPVWTLPGQAEDTVTVHLGYGRTRAGRVGNGAGFDANRIRTSDAPWFGTGLEVARTGATRALACAQDHWTIDRHAEERHIVRSTTLGEYAKDPERIQRETEVPPRDMTLYPNFKYDGHAWGMSIDLNSCTGCSACVVACQAENNIPVVGRGQVAMGREMHWLRVDRYFSGDPGRAETIGAHFQPLPCMHCENAPCEQVCPVAATVHSDEGLNDQVYNRCVGTRYCSNNCPYKVRRFNFFLYQDWATPTLKLQRNPDVTVRSRGVMEKCTYCVQRIEQARITAHNENREIRDGEIQTACQSVCPTEAIVFGDVNDPTSRVSRLKAQHRNYAVLSELNTRPRTTYLAEVKNPNPEIPGAAPARGDEHHG
jgi:molybdopterin-containing oxidoreductase family iron-sulfur binding subunit